MEVLKLVNNYTTFFSDHVNNIEQKEIEIEQEYPVGTELYFYSVTDPKNRYLKLPWSSDDFWIETHPLCKDIYVTEENYQKSIDFFTEHKCLMQPKEFHKKIIIKKQNPRIVDTFINEQNGHFESLLNLIKTNANVVVSKDIIKPLSKTLEMNGRSDAVCDIEGVKTIKIYISSLSYNHFAGIEFISIDPKHFTIENPLQLQCCAFNRVVFELDDNVNQISYNYLYYDCDVRRNIIKNTDYIGYLKTL